MNVLMDGNAGYILKEYWSFLQNNNIHIDKSYFQKWCINYIDDHRTKKKPISHSEGSDEVIFHHLQVMQQIKNKKEGWKPTMYHVNTLNGTFASVIKAFQQNWECVSFPGRPNTLKQILLGGQHYYFFCKCQLSQCNKSNSAFDLICVRFSVPKKLQEGDGMLTMDNTAKLVSKKTSVISIHLKYPLKASNTVKP